MLRLASDSDPTWVSRALDHLDEVLVDHAHCEKKAASSALGMIFAWPEQPGWMAPLSELAREELSHFELVLRVLERRGIAFHRQIPSEYGARLNEACRKGRERILDKLLCAALVEARSCERMQLLAEALAERDPDLSRMFTGLLASEARHHQLFVDLAKDLFEEETVMVRLAELAEHEARILIQPCAAVRMHSA